MRIVFILLGCILMLSSCDDKTVQTQQFTFKSIGWPINDAISFDLKAPDTINTYDIFIHMRNNHEYMFDNLWIVSELQFPHGRVITDTLQYKMANPQGQFLGSGSGGVYENKLWCKQGVRFRESGTYKINLRQLMRKPNETDGVPNLTGVLDIGYSLEKSTTNGNK